MPIVSSAPSVALCSWLMLPLNCMGIIVRMTWQGKKIIIINHQAFVLIWNHQIWLKYCHLCFWNFIEKKNFLLSAVVISKPPLQLNCLAESWETEPLTFCYDVSLCICDDKVKSLWDDTKLAKKRKPQFLQPLLSFWRLNFATQNWTVSPCYSV